MSVSEYQHMGDAWRAVANLIGDETKPLTERKDAARSILSTLSECTDDPIIKTTYDGVMRLIEYIDRLRYDAASALVIAVTPGPSE